MTTFSQGVIGLANLPLGNGGSQEKRQRQRRDSAKNDDNLFL
jgi:hypothetical protein